MTLITAFDPAWPGSVQASAWHTVVLAGDRQSPDPVAQAAGTTCKAMAPVAGRPMLERVTDALRASRLAAGTTLCGPGEDAIAASPQLSAGLSDGWLTWRQPAATPSASVAGVLNDAETNPPLLVTTGDHALLTPDMVAAFGAAITGHDWDAAVAVVPHGLVTARYPEARPTATRLRGGALCGCNLFALKTDRSRYLVDLWAGLEQRRKHPWRTIAGTVGPRSLIDYALGRLSLHTVLERLSRRLGVRVGAVLLPYAAAGLDVDTVADWELADRIARGAA